MFTLLISESLWCWFFFSIKKVITNAYFYKSKQTAIQVYNTCINNGISDK